MSGDRILVDRNTWDAEYVAGRWDYLGGPIEGTRYACLADEIMQHNPAAKVLDLGCGQGLLLDALRQRGFTGEYMGIDWSQEVLERARRQHGDVFRCADLNSFTPEGPLDAVVLSEVLYYLEDPLRLVQAAQAASQARYGFVLISIYQPRAGADSEGNTVLSRLLTRIVAQFSPEQMRMISNSENGRSWSLLRIQAEPLR